MGRAVEAPRKTDVGNLPMHLRRIPEVGRAAVQAADPEMFRNRTGGIGCECAVETSEGHAAALSDRLQG